MKIIKKYFKGNNPWRLWFVADIHLGSRSCDEQTLFNNIESIRQDPHAIVMGVGDYAEFISHLDDRYVGDNIPLYLREYASSRGSLMEAEYREVVNRLKPIADKIIGLAPGNHESKYESWSQNPVTMRMATELGTHKADWATLYYLHFFKPNSNESNKLVVFCEHGDSSAKSLEENIKVIRNRIQIYEADVYVMAHSHFKAVVPTARYVLVKGGTRRIKRTLFLILAGGYTEATTLETTVYTEKRRGSLRVLGSACIEYNPWSGKRGSIREMNNEHTLA